MDIGKELRVIEVEEPAVEVEPVEVDEHVSSRQAEPDPTRG
ncbi:MAG: hypothetical protein ACLFRT_13370 [Actinomycetota bacterium]